MQARRTRWRKAANNLGATYQRMNFERQRRERLAAQAEVARVQAAHARQPLGERVRRPVARPDIEVRREDFESVAIGAEEAGEAGETRELGVAIDPQGAASGPLVVKGAWPGSYGCGGPSTSRCLQVDCDVFNEGDRAIAAKVTARVERLGRSAVEKAAIATFAPRQRTVAIIRFDDAGGTDRIVEARCRVEPEVRR